jgi:hypothetical protein
MSAGAESALVAQARRELGLLTPGRLGQMDSLMAGHILALVQVFASQGHSGFSAGHAIDVLTKLLRFEPLTPLTGEPHEWHQVGPKLYQNLRCSHVFSETGTPDGPAEDIEGRVFVDQDGNAFTNQQSRTPVKFPYTPTTIEVAS